MSSSSSSVPLTSSSSLYAIDKLNSTNFSAWKFRMQMILIDRGLWEYVDGSQPAPVLGADTNEAAQAKLVEWKKKDNCAMAQIALTVGNTELVHVKGAKSSREAWLKLCSAFEAKGLASKVFLRRKFFSIQMPEGISMQAHINNVKELAEQLEAIGATLTDSDIAMTLLSSLPEEEYGSLVTALEARPSDELTTDFVIARLLAEEKRRQESFKAKVYSSAESAFIGNYNQGGSTNRRSTQKCGFCKRTNHTEEKCYRKHGYPVGHPLHNKTNVAAITRSNDNGEDSNKEIQDEDLWAFTSQLGGSLTKQDWVIDSAASDHYCNNKAWFTDFQSIPVRNITIGDNRVIHAVGRGNVPVKVQVNDRIQEGVINQALYVPDIGVNLISVSRLALSGLEVSFVEDRCVISNKSGKVLACARRGEGNLYRLPIRPSVSTAYVGESSDVSPDVKLWHDRLGHLNLDGMRLLNSGRLVKDFPPQKVPGRSEVNVVTQCEACIKGKSHRAPMPQAATHRATKVLELVHSDVCGPIRTPSIGGAKYFVTFIDDYSRFVVVKSMKLKSEVMGHFTAYRSWAENVTNRRIKVLRSDNGGEYISKEFDQLLAKLGITRQTTPPYTPEHNGVAERANRTIVECARSMMQGAHLDYSYWGEAVMTAVYLRNRSPSRSVQRMTPYEAWTGEKPSLSHLKVFGCRAFAHIPDEKRTKLEPKAIECVFVGYSLTSKAYRLYDPIGQRLIT